MKYDYCGEMGLVSLNSTLKAVDSDPKVDGVILDMDTPGGAASFLPNIAKTLQNMHTPVATFFSGMCCSAGYYIASNTQAIFASTATDEVGSIGTVISFEYRNPENTDADILQKTIYATGSTRKHEEFIQAIEGNDDPMRTNRLDPLNDSFHANVLAGRPDIAKEALTGCVYNANAAIEANVIDGIKSLDQVVEYMVNLLNDTSSNTEMKFNFLNKNANMPQSYFDTVSNILGRTITSENDLTQEDYEKLTPILQGNFTPEESSAELLETNPLSAEELTPIVTTALQSLLPEALETAFASSTALGTRIESIVDAALEDPAAGAANAGEDNPDGDSAVDAWDDPENPINAQIAKDLENMGVKG